MGLSREELSEPVSSFVQPPLAQPVPAQAAAAAPVAPPAPVTPPAAVAEPGFSVSDFKAPRAADFAAAPVAAPSPAPAVVAGEEGKKQKLAALTEQGEQLKQQVAALERRCDEQDAAIRRILGLLIDWVEQGDEQAPAAARGRAA
jgi:hypothetical protein